MNLNQMVRERFWLHHHLKINLLSTDIIYLRHLIIFPILLVQASLASNTELIVFETMTGSFVQTSKTNEGQNDNVSEGYLAIKRPDLMLWHIKEPTERIIIFEQGLVSIFDPDLNQVIKTQIDQFEDANWIRILMGESILIKNYELQIDEHDSYKLIRYKPLNKDSLRTLITIKIKEELIEYINIESSKKEKIHIALHDVVLNGKIDDEFLDGFIPNNADVIE